MLQFACAPFATPQQLLADACACDLASISEADLLDILDDASDLVCILTGGRVTGRCQAILRPYVTHYCSPSSSHCGCGPDILPLHGIDPEVLDVRIDGVALSVDEYMVLTAFDGSAGLIRRDGAWPSCQDLTQDDTETDTFSITLEWGNHTGFTERQAALELACELAKESLGRTNRLPNGTTSATMGGVSVQTRDRAEAMRDGTDLPRVSRLVSKWALHGQSQNGVWSPEQSMGWTWVQVAPVSS